MTLKTTPLLGTSLLTGWKPIYSRFGSGYGTARRERNTNEVGVNYTNGGREAGEPRANPGYTVDSLPESLRRSARKSASTIMATNSLKLTLGCQASSRLALPASPIRRSTSVGR